MRATTPIAVLLALGASLACAPTHAPAGTSSAPETEHEHWRKLDPSEQHELEARFEELKQLAPTERNALEDLKRDLDRKLEHRFAELPQEERAKLVELPPQERKSVLREMLLAEKREQGMLKRPKLPQLFLDELERAQPRQRRPLFDAFRQKVRDEGGREAMRHLGERLGLSRIEIERRQGLPLAERLGLLLSMRRQVIERDVEQRGLPPFTDEQAWQELKRLSDAEFMREWNRRLPRTPGGALRSPHLDERSPVGPNRPGPRGPLPSGPRSPQLGPQGPMSPGPRAPGGSGTRPPRPAEDEGRDPLLEGLLRPRIDDLIELRRLPPAERKEKIEQRVRERALRFLEEHGGLPADEIEELKKLQGEEFFARLRMDLRERTLSPDSLR